MKKLMVLALIMYTVSCSNPEDHATGNPDSTSFNQSEGTNLNTATDLDKQATEMPDTSAAPAIDKKNANSKTDGTNRSYGTDSAKEKSQ